MTTTAQRVSPGPLGRVRAAVREVVDGLPVPVLLLYLVVTVVNVLLFAHGDIHWTINASYSYLTGHVTDFYDHNLATVGGADYFPTVYAIFALWMAPVKALLSTDAQPGGFVTPAETLWAKALLLLVFWATVWVLARIAREIFDDERSRIVVRVAYLLSPFAAFAVTVFAQYDVIGVFFTLLGFRYYLRAAPGDKWRFALFFAIAASCKYFALVIFVPLLLLRFKKLADLVALSAVAGSVLVLESLLYLHSPAFRSRTLLGGLASDKVAGAGQQQITIVLGILFATGCVLLWRSRVEGKELAAVAVHSAALAYGFMLLAVVWNPQWFMVLTPFYALSLGFLRRPGRFLLWESLAFVGFVWFIVDRSPGNVDVTMILGSPLRDVVGEPSTLMSSVYRMAGMSAMNVVVVAFLLSPSLWYVAERFPGLRMAERAGPVATPVWTLRAVTTAVAFTIPALVVAKLPVDVAERLDPAAGTYNMDATAVCETTEVPYGEVADGTAVRQSFSAPVTSIDAVGLRVGTYGRTADGTLDLTLRDAGGTVLGTDTADLRAVPDNGFVYLRFDPSASVATATLLELEIRTTGLEPGEGVALWGSAADCTATSPAAEGDLVVGGRVQPGDLVVSLLTRR